MEANGFKITELRPNSTFLKNCASLYCEIWKEPPWNEDFWTTPEVMREIKSDLNRKQSKGFIARSTVPAMPPKIIGFTWGYEVTEEEMRLISGTAQMDNFFKDGNRVFYINELGVSSDARVKGVGLQLSSNLLDWTEANGFMTILLRTDLRAMPARTLYARLGFVELDVIDAKEQQRSYWALHIR